MCWFIDSTDTRVAYFVSASVDRSGLAQTGCLHAERNQPDTSSLQTLKTSLTGTSSPGARRASTACRSMDCVI
jgi:hypothetical protein